MEKYSHTKPKRRTVQVTVGESNVCVSLPSSNSTASLAESEIASAGAIGDTNKVVAEAKPTVSPRCPSIDSVPRASLGTFAQCKHVLQETSNTKKAVRIFTGRLALVRHRTHKHKS